MNYQEDIYVKGRKGLTFERFFTSDTENSLSELDWGYRDSKIVNNDGTIIFQQKNIFAPKQWSQTAIDIMASKYFCFDESGIKETSIAQCIMRVVNTITDWGKEQNYFDTDTDCTTFEDELSSLLCHQVVSFNSPVWFNVGAKKEPQTSACFINSIEDSMNSIMDLAKIEANLFKNGSGTGTNFSPLRGKGEALSKGGVASGPVSFMKGFDAFAGIIRSGGKMRRAAKMVILDVDHPDIMEFINCKVVEEKKAHALIKSGYDNSLNGEAYSSIFYQNSNNSVRVSNRFMDAVENDKKWTTLCRTTGGKHKEYDAVQIFHELSKAIYSCGDPSIQFDDTINSWNTCSNSGDINASNPCSEYMFLDNTSCNLASLNLMKFHKKNEYNENFFDVKSFKKAIDILITAQDILINKSGYPTNEIKENSIKFRALGLGYSNLGALLMVNGFPYDSVEGRSFARAITAIMTGEAYFQSGRIASCLGPFKEYISNQKNMNKIIEKHTHYLDGIWVDYVNLYLVKAAKETWRSMIDYTNNSGFRNAQVTLLAPTGTISFVMDCDTTGIEPEMSLVKYKTFVDGNTKEIVNKSVEIALGNLSYNSFETSVVLDHIKNNGSLEKCNILHVEHIPIFDCALSIKKDGRCIKPTGHVDMLSAVQPFLSGAISKTVNIPEDSTVEDIKKILFGAWKNNLKAIAIYRENSKKVQPLATFKEKDKKVTNILKRLRLPDERRSLTHKFTIGEHEGYITVGMYDDGTPGEIFINMSKAGSVVNGLMDSIGIAVSVALQYGVPLEIFINKYEHSRFEPSGITKNEDIPLAKSILDYIFKWLSLKFVKDNKTKTDVVALEQKTNDLTQNDSEVCKICGSFMMRSGRCFICPTCGTSNGCS